MLETAMFHSGTILVQDAADG